MNRSSWRQVPLGSIGEFRNGVNFSKKDMGMGLGLINVKDLFSDVPRIDYSTLDKVNLEHKKGIGKYHVQAGDLFFVRSSVKREGIGLVSYAPSNNANVVHCGFVIRFRLTSSEADPTYLTYLLRSPLYRQKIINISSGAAITNISQGSLGELLVSLPPLPTQREIAAILSAYDDLIENNTRRIAILEEMAQMLYREWFVRFRFPGHEDVRMVQSDLGPIPEGWKIKPLGEIAKQVRRNVKPDELDSQTPYIGLAHMPKDSAIALPNWENANKTTSAKLLFKTGEILFGKIRPYFHKVGVAPMNGVCSTDTIVIVPKHEKFFGVVLGCVSSKEFVDHATQSSTGTKMPRANWNILMKYPVPIPSEHLLSQFSSTVEDAVSLVQNLIFRNHALRHTRDLLLPRLISGEVDVTGLDIAG